MVKHLSAKVGKTGDRLANKNKIALISNDYTKEQITSWQHQNDLLGVLCCVELECFHIKSGYYEADKAWCEGIDWAEVCGIVMLDCDGSVNQSQVPALGISVPPEGHELYNQGLWVQLCGFNVFLEDIPKFDQVTQTLDKCDPCAVSWALECCLIDLALVKDDKAGLSFMDTSLTFRKSDVSLIERLQAKYQDKCYRQKSCRKQSRFFGFTKHGRRC